MAKRGYEINCVDELGQVLRTIRTEQSINIYDAADGMEGSTHGTQVTSWETGRVKPSLAKIIELLEAYDYRVVFVHKRDVDKVVPGVG
jgi:hypothetical protein